MKLFNNMTQKEALILYNAIKWDLTFKHLTRQDTNLLHNAQEDIMQHTDNLTKDYN